MATIEELLISLKVDPKSVRNLVGAIDEVKEQAAREGEIELKVDVDATAIEENLVPPLEAAQALADEFAQDLQVSFDKAKGAVNELKTSLLALGAAGVGLAGVALNRAVEESQNLAQANVLLGFSADELARAQTRLRGVADEVGLSYQEVSQALFDVASAGIQGEAAIEVITVAARAAVPAGIELSVAFNAIATAMNNFGITAEEAGDKLVAIADITRGTLADVSDSLGRLGPIATQFKITFDEVGASFALITNRGINAAEATTGLRATINAFIGPSEQAKKVLDKLKISYGDNAFVTQSFSDKLRILAQASKEGRVELNELFSVESLAAAATLIGGVEELEDNLDKLGGATGRVREAFSSFIQQAGPQLNQLLGLLGNVITSVGQDLLNAIAPAIKAFAAFVRENKELVVLLVEVGIGAGLIVAGLTALGFIISQITAAYTLWNALMTANVGATTANTAAVTANTTAVTANTTARAAGMGLFTTAARLLQGTVGILTTETGVLINNARAWWARNAAQAAAAGQSGVLATGFQSVKGGLASIGGLLGTNIKNLSLLGNAAGVAAAAFVGWEIGSFINDFFELEKATEDYIKVLAGRNAQTGFKGALTQAITTIGTFGTNLIYVNRAIQTNLERSKREIENFARLEAVPGAIDKYNQLIDEGFNATQAFVASMNEANEYALLLEARERALAEGRDLSGDQLARLTVLTRQYGDATDEASQKVEEAAQVTASSGEALKILERTEKEYVKILKQSANEIIEVRQGQAVAQLKVLSDESNKIFDLLKQRGAAEQRILTDTLAKLKQLQATGRTDVEFQQQQARLVAAAQSSQDKLNQIRAEGLRQQEIYESRSKQIVDQRIRELQDAAEKEIQTERRRINAIISENEKFIAERQRQIDDIVGAQRTANQEAARLVEQARIERIQRVDPARAQLAVVTKESAKLLETVSNEKLRNQLLADTIEKLKRIAGETENEKRLRKEIAQIQARLGETTVTGETALSVEQGRREYERSQQLVKELNAEEEKRLVRQRLLTRLIEKVTDAAQTGENIAAIAAQAITRNQQDIASVRQENEQLEKERAAAEKAINDQLDLQIEKLNTIAGIQKTIKDLSNQILELQKQGGAAASLENIQQRIQTLQKLQGVLQTGKTQEAADQAAAAGQAAEAAALNLEPAMTAMTAAAQSTEVALGPVSAQLDDVASTQDDFTNAVDAFGQEVATKLEGMQDSFTTSRESLLALLGRIRGIETEPTLREQDLETAGLA